MKDVLIIIPAFNEEESIGTLLDAIRADEEIMAIADVLVVNDGSKDATASVVRMHGAMVLNHVFNLGYGAALQTGYKYAVRNSYKYVIQIDADGQHDKVNILNIYNKLTTPDENGQHPDIVIGSRFVEGGKSFYISPIKKVSINFFRSVIRSMTNQQILDPTSGLQGLTRDAFSYYSEFNQFDIMYPDANMIIQMVMEGFRVVEIPSVMHERKAGVSMHSGIIKPMLYMLTMPLNIMSVFLNIRRKVR